VEDTKLYDDKIYERLVAKIRAHGGCHTFVSFAVEDGGRLEAHAQSFFRCLVVRVVRQGRRSRTPSRDSSGAILRIDGATQVILLVQRWQRHISTWLHLTLSRQLLGLFCPQQAADAIRPAENYISPLPVYLGMSISPFIYLNGGVRGGEAPRKNGSPGRRIPPKTI
jgi:hypothetical protein